MNFDIEQNVVRDAVLQALEQDANVVFCFDRNREVVFSRTEIIPYLVSDSLAENKAVFRNEIIETQIYDSFNAALIQHSFTFDTLVFKLLIHNDLPVGFVVSQVKVMEKHWRTLLKLGEISIAPNSLEELVARFSESVSQALSTQNLFLALYDERKGGYYFPYFEDSQDQVQVIERKIAENSFTNFVRISGKPILIQKHELRQYSKEYAIEVVGTPAESWIGMPIKIDDRSIGVFVVQSYDPAVLFDNDDLAFVDQVSQFLGHSIKQLFVVKELNRNKELQEISNSISKVSTFEYAVKQNMFFPIGYLLDVLNVEKVKAGYTFDEFLCELKAEDRYLIEKDFQSFDTKKIQQFEREVHLKESGNTLKFFAFKTHKSSSLILGLVQDITLIKQNEKVLKMAFDKVQQADRLKSEFMAALSYEVRAPINAVIGFSNLMIKPDLSESDKSNYHRIVRQNGEALIKLIDEMVDVSRIESGEVKIHLNPTDLNRLLNNILVFSEKKVAQGKNPNIEVILHKSHKTMVLLTDEARLAQIINTLINNAIHYTEKGYVQFGYHIIDREQPLIEFFVKDTGSGIPAEKQDALFNRYGKMEGDRVVRPGVTSLGLSISKDLIRLMGGEMTVESKPKQGTTFYFYLPYKKAPDFEQQPTPKHFYIQARNRSVQILVAEDDVSTFKLIQESFANSKMKIEFEFASNGLEAIEKLRLQQYDLILMDLKMPLMDGVKTTEYIRKKLPKPKNNTPIIALTANALQETRRICLEVGFNGFITKPFLPEDLINKVNEVIS